MKNTVLGMFILLAIPSAHAEQAIVLFKELAQGENTINIIYSTSLIIGGVIAGICTIIYLRRR